MKVSSRSSKFESLTFTRCVDRFVFFFCTLFSHSIHFNGDLSRRHYRIRDESISLYGWVRNEILCLAGILFNTLLSVRLSVKRSNESNAGTQWSKHKFTENELRISEMAFKTAVELQISLFFYSSLPTHFLNVIVVIVFAVASSLFRDAMMMSDKTCNLVHSLVRAVFVQMPPSGRTINQHKNR